jgi:CSLREA domain-containing protein
MSTFSGQERSLRVPTPPRRSFCASLYARSLRCEQLEDRRLLAVIPVTTDQDIVDLNDGVTSLREAIFAANIVPGADEIVFDFGHDEPAKILLTEGELEITDALTITGLGAELLAIDNSLTQGPIFNVDNLTNNVVIEVGLSGMTLTGSKNTAIHSVEDLTVDGMIFRGNSGQRAGGISVEQSGGQALAAKLKVYNSRFEDNHVTNSAFFAAGGGISFIGRMGELAIEGTTFVGNSSDSGGGGLGIGGFSNLVNIIDSQFIDNEGMRGGGILISDDNAKVATLTRVELRHNTASLFGDGIYITGKAVTIADSEIVGNRTISTTTISMNGGGGIYKQGSDAFIVSNSTIRENQSVTYGGGILLQRSGLQLTDSTIEQNTAIHGGGISLNEATTVEISRSNLLGNTALVGGGGLYSQFISTNLRILDSTISGNSANKYSGGLFVAAGSFLLRNSTVSGNTAGESGGGLLVGQGTRQAIVELSTITGNRVDSANGLVGGLGIYERLGGPSSAPQSMISHSIISGNYVGTTASDLYGQPQLSYSLIGSNAGTNLLEAPVGSPDAQGNLIGGPIYGVIDPLLGPLADNGGPTKTHALLPGSPAIDAGVPALASAPEFDQRGYPFARIFGSAIDIGAYEAQSFVVDTLVDENDGDYSAGDFSLREAIELANRIAGANTIEFSPLVAGGTILMTMGEFEITDALTITGLGAELLTIDASGNDPTPDVNKGDGSKIFNIDDGKADSLIDVSLRGLTLTGADGISNGGAILSYENLIVAASIIRDNSARNGAGIYSQAGTITSEGSSFLDNEALDRSAIVGRSSVRLVDSTLTGNKSGDKNAGSTVTAYGFTEILNSTISHNSMAGLGAPVAAIDARGGVSLIDSIIASNTNLGGVSGFTRDMNYVIRSIIQDNDGVGISSATFNTGKGIIIVDSTITGNRNAGISILHMRGHGDVQIIRTTISDNVGGGRGSGIANAGGATLYVANGGNIFIEDCTITGNIAHTTGHISPVAYEGGGGLRIQTGSMVTITRTLVARNSVDNELGSNAFGGGIYINAATASISDSQIIDNTADGAGGGIVHMSGLMTLVRTEIAGNSATDHGGGIYSVGQNLNISDSDISNNTGGNGGGIVVNNLNITHSTISNNHALGSARIPLLFPGRGGGILAAGSATRIQIVECVIENNTAVDAGGGIYAFRGLELVDSLVANNEGSVGGGVWVKDGVISQSTISANRAIIGGGIYADNAVVKYSTVALNMSSSLGGGIFVAGTPLTLSHVIVGRNSGTNPEITGVLGSVVTATYSLIRSNTGSGLAEAPVGSPDVQGNLIGGPIYGVIDPRLGPLADNGGPTKTHALLPGSPAIDAGLSTSVGGANGVPLFDQRGAPFARIAGGRIDIGAYESQPAAGLFNADFDGDGDIDGRDFLIWQRGYGRKSGAAQSDGDATVDGRVDGVDLVVWQGTYGETIGEVGLQNAESEQSEVNDSQPFSVPQPHDRFENLRTNIALRSEHSAFIPPQSEILLDRVFDHWLPVRRFSLDFGDIATHRPAKRRAS